MLQSFTIAKDWCKNQLTKKSTVLRRCAPQTTYRPEMESLEDRRLLTTIFGLTDDNRLARFDSASPGNLNVVAISNIVAGDKMVAMDFQPGTGLLYALGVNGKIGRFYVLDTGTAVATQLGDAIVFPVRGGLPLPEADFGFDFDPVRNVIRVVANNRDNFRWDPGNGRIIASDTPLNPGSPVIVGAAYTNNFAGAKSTTLYDIDRSTDQLFIQGGNPVPPGATPNAGVLTPVGSLGVHLSSNEVGFDIAQGTNTRAFAALPVNGVSGLYTINLTTGAATLVGNFGGGIVMRDISVAADPTLVATHFMVSTPSSAVAGAAIPVTVTALDQFNQPTVYYTGTFRFTSTDSKARLGSEFSLFNGTGSFPQILVTAGIQTITATDNTTSSITGTSNTIAVSPNVADSFLVETPGLKPNQSQPAGAPFTVVVTVRDRHGNTVTDYTGTVRFSSNDPKAVLPSNTTLTNGTGTFKATLNSEGTFTITATDSAQSGITGTTKPIIVTVAHRFIIFTESGTAAGSPISVIVQAVDEFGAIARGYTGTIHFSKTDFGNGSSVPADYAFTIGAGGDNGVHAFTNGVTFVTAGTQTLTVRDTVQSALFGTADVRVTAAALDHFAVTAPPAATAGTAFGYTVTALDRFNNQYTAYASTVHFTSTDGQAVLPADSTLTNGTGTFNATFKTPGSQTITATDTVFSTAKGTSNTIAVSAAATTHFALSAPATAKAGVPFNFTVSALDQFNNPATGYSGTVRFTSTDGAAVLPANSTLTNGSGTFSATLNSAGDFVIAATDTVNSSITGSTGPITVAVATRFVVTAPASATAGSPFSFTVAVQDQFGNPATGYKRTVHFTKSDAGAGSSIPADYTFTTGAGGDNGTHTFTNGATLVTAGIQTITATDTVKASLTDTSNAISVTAAAATHFAVVAPPSATAGTAFNYAVTALDQFNNKATSYSGSVHFTSTDGQAVLPADSTLTNGAGTFTATLKTPGNQTVTATDTVTPSITGTSNSIAASAAAATHFSIVAPSTSAGGTIFSFTITALDQFNKPVTSYSGTVHFTSTDPLAALPPDSTLTNGAGTFNATLNSAGTFFIAAADTVAPTVTGTSNPIFNTLATRFIVAAQPVTTAGLPFTIVVTAVDQFGNIATGYRGMVHFTKTDFGSGSSVPADYTFTTGTSGDNGVHSFTNGAILVTSGIQSITATDTVSGITGDSNDITVNAAAATHLSVTAPPNATAGTPLSFTIAALDPFNNTATSYSGTVQFSSTDSAATLPANSTLTNGTGTFSATLKTPGNRTITATDTVTASVTGTSNVIAVSAAAATRFVINAPSSASGGVPFISRSVPWTRSITRPSAIAARFTSLVLTAWLSCRPTAN